MIFFFFNRAFMYETFIVPSGVLFFFQKKKKKEMNSGCLQLYKSRYNKQNCILALVAFIPRL